MSILENIWFEFHRIPLTTGRFDIPTMFSAILNAKAPIVSDELTPKDEGTIPPSTM